MSRPPPARPTRPVWLYHNETIDNITPCLFNRIQWIEYLTARLDVPYDIEYPNVDMNELFRRNMMSIEVRSLAYSIKKVGIVRICNWGEY